MQDKKVNVLMEIINGMVEKLKEIYECIIENRHTNKQQAENQTKNKKYSSSIETKWIDVD